MVALSVSTSAMMSPLSIRSPTLLRHAPSCPSVIVSDNLGMIISVAICPSPYSFHLNHAMTSLTAAAMVSICGMQIFSILRE